MERHIHVALLPSLLDRKRLPECHIVVTDILRATSTIVSALRNGARQVIPAPDIPTALRLKEELGEIAVLGGERGGVIIPGFHNGNSPREFTSDRIAGRVLVLCTTNGTVAMEACREAARVLVGAFVNLSSIVEALAPAQRIAVLCSGTDGQITSEDALFAGAVVERLLMQQSAQLDDQASIALGWWQTAQSRIDRGQALADILSCGRGGRNLRKLNYHQDIEFCASIDQIPVVPRLDTQSWRIEL